MSHPTTNPEFNPSGKTEIQEIKSRIEGVMDYVREHCPDPRTKAIALTHLETASMFACKSFFVKS